MTSGKPDGKLAPSKRPRGSHSRSMTEPPEVIDLTKSSNVELTSSRKHDRHERDLQVESPSKRAKLQRFSEPPLRKDTSTIPQKPRKARKKVDNHKATRAKNYNELKESNKILELELADAKQAIRDMKQDLGPRDDPAKLKRAQKLRDEKSYDKELRTKDEVIVAKQEQLENKTKESAFYKQQRDELRLSLEAANKEHASMEARLTSETRKLTEANEKIENLEQELEVVRNVNDTNGSWNSKLTEKAKKAKDSLAKVRIEHRKAISTLKAEKSELWDQCKDLDMRMKSQESDYNKIIISLQQELQDSQPQSQRFNFKVPDEKVEQDFAALESRIRQFVYKYTRPLPNAPDQELQLAWPNWSSQLRNFLASPVLCNLVFEAYIWEQLLGRVFEPWSEVWDGELGRSLETVLSMASARGKQARFESETYAHYQYLRSSSSSFICRLNGEKFQPKDFNSAVEAILSTLARLCELPEITDAMKADAIGIFKHARRFEIQLRKLKAAYSFCMWGAVKTGEVFKYGVFFDDKSMDDRSPAQSDKRNGRIPRVDFIQSPGLLKRGNNDGDKYEDEIWLVKTGVVCDAARFFLNSDPSAAARPFLTEIPKVIQLIEVGQEEEDQKIVPQGHAGTTEDDVKLGTPMSNSPAIKVEGRRSEHSPDPLSTPSLISTSSAPKAHDAAQMRPETARKPKTRSQGPPEPDNNVQDGKSSIKSEKHHL